MVEKALSTSGLKFPSLGDQFTWLGDSHNADVNSQNTDVNPWTNRSVGYKTSSAKLHCNHQNTYGDDERKKTRR